ncbi:hypothetical protein N7530_006942 [Penicillium desertorum]|uniref:Uncharacterized protein n=1 Tax=Penicillium desertorum TaxID=1303715 RepID=A0A9X0BML6_9EURO|nr:hypothetical protein N7530_006942 [Penicillium desertorum]
MLGKKRLGPQAELQSGDSYFAAVFEDTANRDKALEALKAKKFRLGNDVPRVKVSADTVVSDMEVSETPKSLTSSGCLGLRLRMPDSKEAVTTVTHEVVALTIMPFGVPDESTS